MTKIKNPTKKTKQLTNQQIAAKVSKIDWGFQNANTKELTHEIHRYSGKYIPQIAKTAIELISSAGDLLLDPYVGSGTTLVEANLLGRQSIGVDINPLAVLISKVKITPIAELELNKLKDFFSDVVFQLSSNRKGQVALLGDTLSKIKDRVHKDKRLADPWYRKWFTEPVIRDFLILDHFINIYKDKDSADLARVAFSNTLRKCSNAHNGYPNVMLDKKKSNMNEPGPLFLKSLLDNIDKVKLLNKSYNPKVVPKVILGNATDLEFKDNSIDAIVTHPPYIGSVPYAEYGLLSLQWLGHDPKELDKRITGGKRQSRDVVERFTEGYKKMLEESYRVLKRNKYIFLLVGDPTVKGKIIDLAQLTKNLASEVGFKFIVEKKRTGINHRANKMGPETALFFQKSEG